MKSLNVPRASYFVFTGDEPRVRRPRDVAMVVIGLLMILWAVTSIDRLPDWAVSLTELVDSSPQWVHSLLAIAYLLSLIFAVAVVVAFIAGIGGRRGALRDVVFVVLITVGLVIILSWTINGEWPYVFPEIDLTNPIPRFPVTRVTMVTGILLVASTYLTRPLRRLGWLAIFFTAFAAIGLSYGTPIHVVGSFGLGLAAAGALMLVVGTPRGYPAPESVAHGLKTLGVVSSNLTLAPKQRWGLVRYRADGEHDHSIDIKVHGRDSFDSQLAAKLWRTLTYKEMGRTVSYSRLQAVEHEALVSLMAERAGTKVPELLAVGNASSEIALIAYDQVGIQLNKLAEDEVTDQLLVDTWGEVRNLHEASISHGNLGLAAVRVNKGSPIITDFDLGSLAPGEDDRAGDIVGLLFSSSLAVGPERAVSAALAGLGRERLVEALPYVQVPAVSGELRREVNKPKKVTSALRAEILDQTGVEAPEPVALRRVTIGSLLGGALLLLIAAALIPAFTSVDYAEIWDILQNADWILVAIAVIVGHTQFFPQATATMFAVPATLPFWPLLTLQTASQFISLAIPSSAGRVAMNAAFLHKFGVSVTVAIAQGAIDGFSGFIVQALILLVVLLTGDIDLGLEISPSDVPWLLILGIVALIVVVVVVVVLRVKKIRERVVPIVSQAWGALMVVLRQPSRAIGLLGSNFVYWNILGVTLWIMLQAVGVDLSYGTALFVAAGTSLLAGFMPVPGGIGVAEATMTALLVTLGVDESAAFAVTFTYRIITFYLPAFEGFFGTRWLKQNDYI